MRRGGARRRRGLWLRRGPTEAVRIDRERLSEVVRALASNEFEGRAPGTAGGRKPVEYLGDRFAGLGLEPGGAAGSWTQAVLMIHTRVLAPKKLGWTLDGERESLRQGDAVEISTVRAVDEIVVDAPVVIVGFGAHAPERGWDDFGEIDLEGKVALFLVNDPDFAAAPGEAVAGRFGNRRMTYYGRWAYKFEEAARRGATAALVIHETAAAGYAWEVASSGPGLGPARRRAGYRRFPPDRRITWKFDPLAEMAASVGVQGRPRAKRQGTASGARFRG